MTTQQLAFNRKMLKQFKIRGIYFGHQPITTHEYDLYIEGTKDELLRAFDQLANQYKHFRFNAPVLEQPKLNNWNKVQKMLYPAPTGEAVRYKRILAGR